MINRWYKRPNFGYPQQKFALLGVHYISKSRIMGENRVLNITTKRIDNAEKDDVK